MNFHIKITSIRIRMQKLWLFYQTTRFLPFFSNPAGRSNLPHASHASSDPFSVLIRPISLISSCCDWVYVCHLTPMADIRPVWVIRHTTIVARTWNKDYYFIYAMHISICMHHEPITSSIGFGTTVGKRAPKNKIFYPYPGTTAVIDHVITTRRAGAELL